MIPINRFKSIDCSNSIEIPNPIRFQSKSSSLISVIRITNFIFTSNAPIISTQTSLNKQIYSDYSSYQRGYPNQKGPSTKFISFVFIFSPMYHCNLPLRLSPLSIVSNNIYMSRDVEARLKQLVRPTEGRRNGSRRKKAKTIPESTNEKNKRS